MKTLQMEDIDWSAEVTRIVCVGSKRPKCQTCHKEYAAVLEVPTYVTPHDPFDMAYVNLPCWHVEYRSGLEVAPDVRVRLLLVAEGPITSCCGGRGMKTRILLIAEDEE